MSRDLGRLLIQFILGIILLSTAVVLAEDPAPLSPPDSLIAVAVKALIKEEKTEALCILVRNGTESSNLSKSLYSALKCKYPRFFECTGSGTTFIVGPMQQNSEHEAILEIRRVSAHSECKYRVTGSGEKWHLRKLPCTVM